MLCRQGSGALRYGSFVGLRLIVPLLLAQYAGSQRCSASLVSLRGGSTVQRRLADDASMPTARPGASPGGPAARLARRYGMCFVTRVVELTKLRRAELVQVAE